MVKELFSKFGKIKSVFIHKEPTSQVPPKEDSTYFPQIKEIKGFKVAYVVFELAKDMRQLLNYDGHLVYPKTHIVTGLNSKFFFKK